MVGMHRSGTSALVGSLQGRGLFLGEHNTANKYNPRGNRESRPVVRLNEDVLKASGGSWAAPPRSVEWSDAHLDRARQILGGYAGRPLWGFKDPRTLLTFAGWETLVPDIELVGVFRDPGRVARSLASRPNLPVADPVDVWRTYNEHLLELHRRRPFPLLSFDDPADVLEQKLDRVAAELGLSSAGGAEPFFTADLRRMEAEPVDVPRETEALYDELRALAL